jgi:hypothetical protein
MQMKKSRKQYDSQLKITCQLISLLLVAGFVIPYAICGHLNIIVSLAVCGLLVAGWFAIVKLLLRAKMSSKDSTKTRDQRIFSLSLDDARLGALKLLNDKSKCDCRKKIAFSRDVDLSQFAPLLREFFQEYESVQFLYGDAQLSRSEIEASEYDSHYIKIGTDCADAELAVLPGEERIIEWSGDDADKRTYPTVYHWLLRLAEDIYP